LFFFENDVLSIVKSNKYKSTGKTNITKIMEISTPMPSVFPSEAIVALDVKNPITKTVVKFGD